MTRGLGRIIVAILTILGLVAAVPVLLERPAIAQSTESEDTSTSKFLKLSLDSVTPASVTTTSDPTLTVSGTVTNIGDRPVSDTSVRLQRAQAIAEPAELRGALQLDQANYDVTGPFEEVSPQLNPGQRQQFTLRIPLGGTAGNSLEITEPGVYPLLLNVNGEPAYGDQARLDDARFLLPVLGVPAAEGGEPPEVPADPAAPVETTVLWPLADRPRMLGGSSQMVDGTTELTDDELASSLDTGGRLDQLLDALETTLDEKRDPRRTDLKSSICVAIDPDLLLTVRAMTNGYRVLASPSDPEGATREGTGSEQATAWLDRLRSLTSSMCTVALPFAQVDMAALAELNDPALTARALEAPADLIDSILSTRSVRKVSLPDSGSIDAEVGQMLRSNGFTTAVLAGNAAAPEGTSETTDPGQPSAAEMVRLPGVTAPSKQQPGTGSTDSGSPAPTATAQSQAPADPALHVAGFDIWSATALAAVGSNPPTPSFTPENVRYEVTTDSRSARLQDALGALSWSALNPRPDQPRSQVLMPPQQWGANRDEATGLLRQVDSLFENDLATPRSFRDLLDRPTDPAPFELDYLDQAATDAVPPHVLPQVHGQSDRIKQLLHALVEVPEAKPTPRQFVTPLRDDLLRILSLSDRRGTPGQADVYAQRRLQKTTRTIDDIFDSVSVLPPGGVYTLASEQSPLLLVARNELPVAIRIRFRIDAPAGTKITDIGEQQLPPRGARSFQVPTEVSDSRRLVIPISLGTPEGIHLGDATSVSVRSNAYGQTLAIITACAGLLLFLLAGRRLWHRFRGQPDPADKGIDPEIRRRVNTYGRARKRVRRQSRRS